jgi:hypothetical protein
MKTSSLKLLSVALVAIALPLAGVRAHEGHDHDKKPPAPEAGSAAEAWTNAQASLKAMQSAAASKDQATMHDEQEKLAASLQYIQQKGIGGTDKARLDGAIKNAIAASERVHVAADANDFDKVEAHMKTLVATMGLVEKQITSVK